MNAIDRAMDHYLKAGYFYGWSHPVTRRYYALYSQRYLALPHYQQRVYSGVTRWGMGEWIK
jgi:hypothetical protein